jgi:hypothetical protein
VKPRVYSSLPAFLAHWQLLAAARDTLSPQEAELLDAMEQTLARLTPDERAALDDHSYPQTGAARRRRERYQLKLQRLLTGEGWLEG